MPKHTFTSLNHTFRYHELGSSQNPHVLLLHGYINTSAMFLPFMRSFQSHYHLIALDLPTTIDPHTTFSFEYLTDYVVHFIHQLNLTPLTLVGFSMGGPIAVNAAQHLPSQVQNLYLLNSSPRIIGGPLQYKLFTKLKPVGTTQPVYQLYSNINSSNKLRQIFKIPMPKNAHLRTSHLLHTTLNVLSQDLSQVFYQLPTRKTVVLFKDDLLISWRKQSKLLQGLNCPPIIFRKGGHNRHPQTYWPQVASIFKT